LQIEGGATILMARFPPTLLDGSRRSSRAGRRIPERG
jgi:hypothetical protein